jgi:hypothetical protein
MMDCGEYHEPPLWKNDAPAGDKNTSRQPSIGWLRKRDAMQRTRLDQYNFRKSDPQEPSGIIFPVREGLGPA